jgi:hypothetical protein
MKKTLTLVLVLMIAASSLSIFATQSSGHTLSLREDLRINSYNTYTSPNTGAFILVGEVQNIGTEYFNDVRIRAVVYNSSDTSVAEPSMSYIYADQLGPGETAGFYMLFAAASSLTGDLSWVESGIHHIDFLCFGSVTDNPNSSGLSVIAHNGAATSNGNYSITGMVINRGTSYAEKYFVVGTCYDSSGEVISIAISEYLEPYLAPNNVTSFYCGLYDALSGTGNQIGNYSVRVVAKSMVETVPTPSPTTSAPTTTTPGTSTTPAASASPSNSNDSSSSNTLYIVLAVVGIVIAVVVLVLLLRRR